MRKYKYEITLFMMNALAMSLELVASRLLSPYFGNANIVWTCIIGIILLSNSIGNVLGGKLSDKEVYKNNSKNVIKYMLLLIAATIFFIVLDNQELIKAITYITQSVKIGAIMATFALFLLPNILIGMLSPLILKVKLSENTDEEKIGKIGGNVYALGTIGSIVGTFASGFWLVPTFGCINILFVLIIVCLINSLLLAELKKSKEPFLYFALIIFMCFTLGMYIYADSNISKKILNGEVGPELFLNTQYGSVRIFNTYTTKYDESIRVLEIEGGAESLSYNSSKRKYDILEGSYMDFYNQCLEANTSSINNMLLIGGAGYSFPKYVISHYPEKQIDVVEIDEKITEVAKKYFYLDDLIKEYDLENNHRLNLIHDDGRMYVRNNKDKSYDLILNDAFIGESPVATLTTVECIKDIKDCLSENGYYIINIVSAYDGEHSKFIKAEMNTLKKVFKNVYCVDFKNRANPEDVNNSILVATDGDFTIPPKAKLFNIDYSNGIVLTDDYCPVESLVSTRIKIKS